MSKWIEWLADIGYGLDVSTDPAPPCGRAELAAQYHRLDPTTSLAEWMRRLGRKAGADGWSKTPVPWRCVPRPELSLWGASCRRDPEQVQLVGTRHGCTYRRALMHRPG
jgi:hypothetical protein